MIRTLALSAAIALGVGCSGHELDLSSTSSETVVLSPPSYAFGSVQVGQTAAPTTISIVPAAGANFDTIESVTETCPDFAVDAEGLPAEVYRTCTIGCGIPEARGQAPLTCEPPLDLVCQTDEYETYAFTATFTPTVAGPLSCVVTITTENATRTVTLSGTGVAPPVEIAVSPSSLPFGDVRVGSMATATLDVKNLGGSTMVVSSILLPAGYATPDATSFDVGPGGDQPIEIDCSPGGAGELGGALVISSNDPSQGSLSVPLQCNGVVSDLAISPSPVQLPATLVGQPLTATVQLQNLGGASTTVQNILVTGAGFTLDASSPTAFPLAAEGSTSIQIDYDAAAHGDATGMIEVDTSDGTRTASLSATAQVASLSLTPDGEVDLGPVCADATVAQTFTIIGNGDGPFDVTSVSMPDAPFTLDAGTLPAHVQPSGGNQVTFTVSVTPTDAGALTTQVAIATDIPSDAPHTITLDALGLPAGTSATPASVDLGSAPLDATTIGQAIFVTNCGGSDLAFDNARIEGSDASNFAIVEAPTSSSIGSDASAQWLVVMTAHTAGTKNAMFSVDASGGTTSVPLTGEGLAPAPPGGSDGSDAGDLRNYYTCAAGGGGLGGLPLAGLALGLVLAARRRRGPRA